MYLTKQSTDALRDIIAALKELDSEQEQKIFLETHVEDPAQLLNTLQKINKKNLPKHHKQTRKVQQQVLEYETTQLNEIFAKKNDEAILQEYSLSDLRNMYYSVYHRRAASGHKKEDIVKALRRHIFADKRGEAFAYLADQRK